MIHDLKSWPANFDALKRGRRFEPRLNDRNYALGDTVHVQEFLPAREQLTGRTLDFRIDDIAPFALPGAPLEHVRHVILHYVAIVEIQTSMEVLPKVDPAEVPVLELWALVRQTTRVLQIVEDERGEAHQLFGTGMDPEAPPGAAGKFRMYRGGAQRFNRVVCAHVFNGLVCAECGMPQSMTGR